MNTNLKHIYTSEITLESVGAAGTFSSGFGLDPPSNFFSIVKDSKSINHLDVVSHLGLGTGGGYEIVFLNIFPSQKTYIPKKWHHSKRG